MEYNSYAYQVHDINNSNNEINSTNNEAIPAKCKLKIARSLRHLHEIRLMIGRINCPTCTTPKSTKAEAKSR